MVLPKLELGVRRFTTPRERFKRDTRKHSAVKRIVLLRRVLLLVGTTALYTHFIPVIRPAGQIQLGSLFLLVLGLNVAPHVLAASA